MASAVNFTHTLGLTQSLCEECNSLVPAKIISDGKAVYFRKFCPGHGETEAFIRSDVKDYLRSQRYVKPAWAPETFGGNAKRQCPEACGFCTRHEQHLCLPVVEITTRCNLACPVCLNSSGKTPAKPVVPWDMSLDEYRLILDGLARAEKQVDVLNLSGGEPLLHPRLLDFIDEALSRKEIVRVSVSTNGLEFLENPNLLEEVKVRDIVVSLQFDGFAEKIYQVLRGRPLLSQKQEILAILHDLDLTTSLTMTAALGVNEDQFAAMLDYLFQNEHVVSLMIQPLTFTGRGAALSGKIKRLTIPDITRILGEVGQPAVATEDFVPLPCSHPLCFSLAFYLMLDNGTTISLDKLTDASTLMDTLSNRVIFGLDPSEHERLKQMIYDLWTGPSAVVPNTEAVLATLRSILRGITPTSPYSCFEPRSVFTFMERKVKSIFIHAFQDLETFDIARIRRCCQAYPQPDGRLVPGCAHNVLHRWK